MAWTFKMFMEHPNREPEQMAIFPMAKAAINGMKAVSEFTELMNITDPDPGHVVFGASKRGWTTWMVGAAD